MVARLKLKEIDGRAPPGVKVQLLFAVTLLLKAALTGWWKASSASRVSGNIFKLRGTPKTNYYQPGAERFQGLG
jgi:hypothetical protein